MLGQSKWKGWGWPPQRLSPPLTLTHQYCKLPSCWLNELHHSHCDTHAFRMPSGIYSRTEAASEQRAWGLLGLYAHGLVQVV